MPEPIKSETPVHDTICQAISILQAVYMARTSAIDGDAMWGALFMTDAAVESAINSLIGILPDVERI